MASWGGIPDVQVRALFQALDRVASLYGLRPTVTSLYRSSADQARLYDRYVRGLSSLPAAPPGRSQHERGRAMDLVSSNNAWLGAVWESWGGRWGGRFSRADPVHFEVTDQMLKRWFA